MRFNGVSSNPGSIRNIPSQRPQFHIPASILARVENFEAYRFALQRRWLDLELPE
jgi:hypothetical protein